MTTATAEETTTVEPRKRATGEIRVKMSKQMQAAYYKGSSIRDIAGRFGRSYGATHLMLAQAGTHFRPRGGAHGR